MSRLLDWLYRRLGAWYFLLHIVFDAATTALVCLGAIGLMSIYQPMSVGAFWVVVGFSEAVVMIAYAVVAARGIKLGWPVIRWVAAGRPDETAAEAWRAAVAFPRVAIAEGGWVPFVLAVAPLGVFLTLRFDLPWYSAGIISAAGLVAIAYAGILSFFAAESLLRPVLRDIVRRLPDRFDAVPAGVSLRWKLLGSLPLINVITGVVVSGLSTTGSASLTDLGLDVIVAVGVAFTLSLELTLMVTRSVLRPVRELLDATERVARGDLGVRVPVLSGDELGRLASSFNAMLTGLQEREKLQSAFGSYVAPGVAERVLEEGEQLEGEKLDATAMFVDVRDFTAFAERASAEEAVARLNAFFDVVVPIVDRHGGHANKFIGDGLLAVFGALERHPDHADRALRAACEIAAAVEARFSAAGVRIGIGLNSGEVVAGSVGGGGRLEFTVIGDAVNVAARVEQATRELGDTILLTHATRRRLTAGAPRLVARGAIELRGKSAPISLFAPVSSPGGAKASSRAAERPKVET